MEAAAAEAATEGPSARWSGRPPSESTVDTESSHRRREPTAEAVSHAEPPTTAPVAEEPEGDAQQLSEAEEKDEASGLEAAPQRDSSLSGADEMQLPTLLGRAHGRALVADAARNKTVACKGEGAAEGEAPQALEGAPLQQTSFVLGASIHMPDAGPAPTLEPPVANSRSRSEPKSSGTMMGCVGGRDCALGDCAGWRRK